MSPIKGLTDRHEALPQIGSISKGAPKSADGKMGREQPFFRVDFDERDTASRDAFDKIYGKQPTILHVVVAFNEKERFWDAWLEAYTASMLVARSDGEKFVYWMLDGSQAVSRDGFALRDIKKPVYVLQDKKPVQVGEIDVKTGEVVPYFDGMIVGKDKKGGYIFCKQVGRLQVVMPELGKFGYLMCKTGSKNDIANIDAQLDGIISFCKDVNGGRVAGVPLLLVRKPKKISVPDTSNPGERMKVTKHLIELQIDMEWIMRANAARRSLAMPGATPLLSAPPREIGPFPATNEEIIGYIEEDDEEEIDDIPETPEIAPDVEMEEPGKPAHIMSIDELKKRHNELWGIAGKSGKLGRDVVATCAIKANDSADVIAKKIEELEIVLAK